MKEEKIHEFNNDEITITWKPKKCIHTAVCVTTLPKVYKPGGKPWIRIENASSNELKEQINKCPSGALTFKLNNQKK